jgi:quercetin dioxygenase-like cupin family protein
MSPEPMVIAPEDRPRSLNVVGEQLTILASGEQTGSFEIFFQSGPEGCGPPPHSHPWDEAFYVLRGEIHFLIEGAPRTVAAGTTVFVPAGTLHCFQLGAGGAEALSITSRAGASAMFTQFDAEISPHAPDLGKLVSIAVTHGLDVAVPPREEVAG